MIEHSYGVIPFFKGEEGLEVFLIHQYGSGGDTLWTFPKGRPEEGESPKETAFRELEEETGLTLSEFIEVPLSVSYTFIRKGEEVEKTSTYFPGFVASKDFMFQPAEVKEAGWFSIPAARLQITFPNYKTLLDEALKNLDK